MKRRTGYVLDRQDDEIVSLFTDLGLQRNIAKTLMYISQVDECRSVDIEQGADLRQPDVSIAMQELGRRKWVKKRSIKKKGKGRPVYLYKPKMDLSEILKAFEQEKLKEIESIKTDISELKNLIGTR